MRILIADDHEVVTRGVAAILHQRDNIEVCDDAPNGEEAVEKARKLNPDIIILDITMPVLNGFAAATQIRRFLPDVPILFLSTHGGRQVVEQVKAVGAQGFVSKQEAADRLLEAVDALSHNHTFFPN